MEKVKKKCIALEINSKQKYERYEQLRYERKRLEREVLKIKKLELQPKRFVPINNTVIPTSKQG